MLDGKISETPGERKLAERNAEEQQALMAIQGLEGAGTAIGVDCARNVRTRE
jgi:hypothetical protein